MVPFTITASSDSPPVSSAAQTIPAAFRCSAKKLTARLIMQLINHVVNNISEDVFTL